MHFLETRDGKKSYDPAPHSEDMQRLNNKFGTIHGVSSLINLTGRFANLTDLAESCSTPTDRFWDTTRNHHGEKLHSSNAHVGESPLTMCVGFIATVWYGFSLAERFQ